MTEKELAMMPVAVHEASQARAERREKRLVALIALLIVLLVGSNVAWLFYESQFETVSTSTEIDAEQDGSGTNIVSGGDVYGTESTH